MAIPQSSEGVQQEEPRADVEPEWASGQLVLSLQQVSEEMGAWAT